jgi:uncharacterized caspase-like protein
VSFEEGRKLAESLGLRLRSVQRKRDGMSTKGVYDLLRKFRRQAVEETALVENARKKEGKELRITEKKTKSFRWRLWFFGW